MSEPRHHRHKDSKVRSFFQEYSFEFIVIGLFGLGVFLLMEKMSIKSYIGKFFVTIVKGIIDFISTLFETVTNYLSQIETSDIVGILLIFASFVLVYMRIRFRIIQRHAYLPECPSCGGDLRRIHRHPKYKILVFSSWPAINNSHVKNVILKAYASVCIPNKSQNIYL